MNKRFSDLSSLNKNKSNNHLGIFTPKHLVTLRALQTVTSPKINKENTPKSKAHVEKSEAPEYEQLHITLAQRVSLPCIRLAKRSRRIRSLAFTFFIFDTPCSVGNSTNIIYLINESCHAVHKPVEPHTDLSHWTPSFSLRCVVSVAGWSQQSSANSLIAPTLSSACYRVSDTNFRACCTLDSASSHFRFR